MKEKKELDARKAFNAIAMILSARNDGIKVTVSEVTRKAAKAS